jgi:hypothetical protein
MAREPIGFYGKFRTPGVDTSAGKRLEALAGLAGGVQDIAVGIGKRAAEERGAEEGIEAGKAARTVDPQTGEITYEPVEKRSEFFYSGSSFNKAALDTAAANIDLDAQKKISEFATTYKDDPEMFQKASSSYLQGVTSSVSPIMAEAINASAGQRILSAQNKINANFLANKLADDVAKQTDNINEFSRLMTNSAREGDVESAAQERDRALLALDNLAEVSPEAKRDLTANKRKINNAFYEQGEIGKLIRVADEQGIPEAYQALENLRKKPKKGYGAEEYDAFIQAASVQLGRAKSRITNAKSVISDENNQKIKEYKANITLGVDVTEDTPKIMALVAGTDNEKEIAMLGELAQFSVQDALTQRQTIDAAIEGGNAVLASELLTQQARLQREISNDALGFAERQGLITKTDLDFSLITSDPEAFGVQLSERKQQAALASNQYGVAVSQLDRSEAAQLTNMLPTMPVDMKVGLAQAFGSESALWSQVTTDVNAGSFSQLGALGDTNVMRTAFSGEERLRTGDVKKVGGTDFDMFKSEFDEIVGDIYGPHDKQTTMQAAMHYYYGALEDSGETADIGLFADAVQAVTGGIETVRGVQTQVMPGVRGDDLDNYFSSLTTDDLKALGADQKIVTDQAIAFSIQLGVPFPFPSYEERTLNKTLKAMQEGTIVARPGKGNYAIFNGNEFVSKPDGSELIFNVTQEDIDAVRSKAFDTRQTLVTGPDFVTPDPYLEILPDE